MKRTDPPRSNPPSRSRAGKAGVACGRSMTSCATSLGSRIASFAFPIMWFASLSDHNNAVEHLLTHAPSNPLPTERPINILCGGR